MHMWTSRDNCLEIVQPPDVQSVTARRPWGDHASGQHLRYDVDYQSGDVWTCLYGAERSPNALRFFQRGTTVNLHRSFYVKRKNVTAFFSWLLSSSPLSYGTTVLENRTGTAGQYISQWRIGRGKEGNNLHCKKDQIATPRTVSTRALTSLKSSYCAPRTPFQVRQRKSKPTTSEGQHTHAINQYIAQYSVGESSTNVMPSSFVTIVNFQV